MKNLFILFFLYLLNNSISQKNETKSNDDSKKSNDNLNLNILNPLFKKFSEEWAQKMSHFHSQYTYSIPVKYKSQVEYYENITKVPCVFEGAILYDEAKSERETIDFLILSPNKTVLFESTSFASIFSINLTYKGLYTIIFNNRRINKEIRPILMVNSGQNLIIEKENLSETEKKLETIKTFLNHYEQDIKIARGFKRRSNEELSTTNRYFFIFSIIETFILIGVSIWQYFYLKHLFEIKGSL